MNTLFRNQYRFSRNSRNNGAMFGWKVVEDIYMRDHKRTDNNLGARTDIVKHAIALDSYTMMNAAYTRHVLSDKQSVK